MNILKAKRDPRLFAAQFPRPEPWARWDVFLAGLYGLPMTPEQLAIFQHHSGRSLAPSAPFTEALALCGRRSGKTRTAALVASYVAAVGDFGPYLAPGERARILIICPDRRQARQAFEYCRAMLSGAHVLADMIERETVDTLELSNGAAIEICTCSSVSVRGYSCPLVIADESAFWSTETSAQSDASILNSLRPTMAQFRQRLLLLISSPWAKRGEVYRLDREYFGRDDAPVLVWHGTSAEMNPTLAADVIAQARARDPVMAATEYDGEFMPDISSAFDPAKVEAAIDSGVRERAPSRPSGSTVLHGYVGFVDPAGGSGSDSYTAAIAHAEGEAMLLDAVLEVRPPFDVEAASEQVAVLCRRYGVAHVEGDHYAGDWPKQALSKRGVEYRQSARNKSQLYVEAVPLFSAARVRLLDHDRLSHQLRALDRRVSRGGKDSIDHPRGGNDDVANACCGALVLAASRSRPSAGEVTVIRSELFDRYYDSTVGDVPILSIFERTPRY